MLYVTNIPLSPRPTSFAPISSWHGVLRRSCYNAATLIGDKLRVTFRKTGVYRRTNEQWLDDLRSINGEQAQYSAYEDLGRYVWTCAHKVVSTLSPEKYPAFAGVSDEVLRDYAWDFTQMTLMKIAENNGARLAKFRGEAPFTSWIAKVTNRLIISEIRKKRYVESVFPSSEGNEKLGDNEPIDLKATTDNVIIGHLPDNPETSLEASQAEEERRRAVERCLEALPERERIAIWAQIIEGKTGKEIADQLHVSRNAVYLILMKTREKLHECLQRSGIQ